MSNSTDELAALRIERAPTRVESRRWVRWAVLVVVLAAVGTGVGFWATRERPIEVEAAPVTQRAAGTQASVLNASGYVTARRRATVSSKITGKVVEVNVEEGMAVRQGQVLARLDDSTYRAALALVAGAGRGGPKRAARELRAAGRGQAHARSAHTAAEGRPDAAGRFRSIAGRVRLHRGADRGLA